LDRVVGTLSHGKQRALELGMALACKPAVLLLDEPMAGTDPEESQRMAELIDALRGTYAIVLVEHDMDAVFRLADRISVLVAGHVIATGTPEAIRANPDVIQAYLGDEAEEADEADEAKPANATVA
ncbi:MAG: ABC transporter ATP-binding protein, partial [Ralstonia sp.]